MINRCNKTIPAFCVALVLLLSLGQPGTAQNSATQQGLSEQLGALVRTKWETILVEAESANEEWAGAYRAYDGPTVTTTLAWSPESGFTVWWYNCSRPMSERVNHGGAVFGNGLLTITPQVAENVAGSYTVPTEYLPVRWGAQHYLIPPNELMKFIYAVNSGVESEIESFLLKTDDYPKKRKGRPAVPTEYARYLGMKPILATISTVKEKGEPWYPKVILNAGKSEGVIPEMKFYRRRGGTFVVLMVTSVEEHTSEAGVITVSSGDDGEGKIQLKRGWRFSSRAPRGSADYLP